MLTQRTAGMIAEDITRSVWEQKRAAVLHYLQGRGFSPKAAQRCFENFVESMAFVARHDRRAAVQANTGSMT